VIAAVRSEDPSAASFAEYEATLRSGLDVWREFILRYYQSPRMFLNLLGQDQGRAGLRQILQGEVYGVPSVPILDRMRRQLEGLQADPDHPWQNKLTPVFMSDRKESQ
jgi:hypothetical protein